MKNSKRAAELIAELKSLAENDFESHRIEILERDLQSPPVVEVIDDTHQKFDGVTYHKNKDGYQVSPNYPIHRAIYSYYYGATPKNHVIHHRDWNKNNNEISNLICLTRSEHTKIHLTQGTEENGIKYIRCKSCHKKFLPVNYQRKNFCSDKCRRTFYRHKEKKYNKICAYCGRKFRSRTKSARFCSLEHSNLYFSTKGREVRACLMCGTEFSVKKSADKKFCTHSCAVEYRRKNKKSSTDKDVS